MTGTVGQRLFVQALVDPAQPVPTGLVSPRGGPDQKRFAVYRNNVHVSLVGALAARFPVCRQLVGAEFFTGMARLYVSEHKPQSPVLLHYGDGFSSFIAAFPPAGRVPYLADMARLEAAWTHTYHAADRPALTAADLGRLAPEALADARLPLAPPTRLVRSRFPIGSIWSAHQREPFVRPAETGAQDVLLTRPGAEVRVTVIPPAAAELLLALGASQSLGVASESVAARHAEFDPGAALVGLTGLGAFTLPLLEPIDAA